jgi:hypothetical protein
VDKEEEAAARNQKQRTEAPPARADRETDQQGDRVELRGAQTIASGISVPATTLANETPGSAARTPAEGRAAGEAAATRAAETPAQEEPTAPRAAASGAGETSTTAFRMNLSLSIQAENRLAAASIAVPERLQDFVERLDVLRDIEVAEETPDQAVEEEGVALAPAEVQPEEGEAAVPETPAEPAAVETPTPFERGNPAPPAPLPRQVQEEGLQQDVRTIASGLRSDAAIQSRLNAEQTARNAEQSARQGQRQEIRDNQTQIRSIQAERRQLQQEVQRADQAIRQLQNRNARMQGNASTPINPATSLDILVE